MLNGLFDIDNRLDYLTENGDMLPRPGQKIQHPAIESCLRPHNRSAGCFTNHRLAAANRFFQTSSVCQSAIRLFAVEKVTPTGNIFFFESSYFL